MGIRWLLACVVLIALAVIYLCTPHIYYTGQILDRHILLFWTGGYDSTFRLCQLARAGVAVQPVYIAAWNTDSLVPFGGRSKAVELRTMHRILRALGEKYPNSNVGPLVIVKYVRYPSEVKKGMRELYLRGFFTRKHSQYGAMATVSREIGNVEECVERGRGTFMGKVVHGYLDGDKLAAGCGRDRAIFRNLRFPVIQYTKQDMLEEAQRSGFDDILMMTRSCWYPRSDGSVCGKCDMCRERIL